MQVGGDGTVGVVQWPHTEAVLSLVACPGEVMRDGEGIISIFHQKQINYRMIIIHF